MIVGGGIAGLAAAATAAGAGQATLLAEHHQLGWGASTRNGGMVIPELKAGPASLERQYGPLGRRLYTAVQGAFDWTEQLIAREGIACDYRRTGQLYLAHHPRVVPHLVAMAAEHRAQGEEVRLVEGEELAAELGSSAYPAGLVMERTGGLHPGRFHAGLVRLAAERGAVLHDHTPVVGVERRAGGFTVMTRRGQVRCQNVIVTTNAYADRFLPGLRRKVLPVGSFIIATEPLTPALAESVSPRGRMFVDTKNFLFYWRLTPDRRLLFGGRKSLSVPSLGDARDFLYASMLRVHPQLEGTAVTHAWGGSVAITLDRLPHMGHLDGVAYATGCNGSGVALNTWMGAQLAELVMGGDPPPFTELTHRTIPLYPLRRLYLPVVGWWFRWQDRGFGPLPGPLWRVGSVPGTGGRHVPPDPGRHRRFGDLSEGRAASRRAGGEPGCRVAGGGGIRTGPRHRVGPDHRPGRQVPRAAGRHRCLHPVPRLGGRVPRAHR